MNEKYGNEKHWNWKGGNSDDYYKKICFQYYPKKCQRCGKDNFGYKDLCVHHIDGNRLNSNISNLLPLCKSCHSIIHKTPK